MKKCLKKYGLWSVICLLSAIAQVGCNTIDEDLSDCGKDYRLTYQLRLFTNWETELQTVLDEESDPFVAQALRGRFESLFNGIGHDVGLPFYGVTGDSALVRREAQRMDANQASFTLYLLAREYMHLPVANMADEQQVEWANDERCRKARLQQTDGDTISSHTEAIYTGRMPMKVEESQDADFHVPLYMANSAVALVIDTLGMPGCTVSVWLHDLADGFNVCDSTYTFNRNPYIEAQEVKVDAGHELAYAAVCFPSRTEGGHVAGDDAATVWTLHAVVTLPDGTKVKNVVNVYEALEPGDLKIIKVRLQQDGSFQPVSTEVGVSVTLDWESGEIYEPEF